MIPTGEGRLGRQLAFWMELDRLAPLLLNAASGGRAWQEAGIVASQVAGVNLPVIARGSAALAGVAEAVVAGAVADGVLPAEAAS